MIYSGRDGGTRHFDDLESVVQQTSRDLRPHLDRFDSIAVRGVSGIVVGAPVSLQLRKPLVVVRKKDERSHDTNVLVNGQRAGERVLFLDDLIAGGTTRRAVWQAITDLGRRLVGEYTYHAHSEWSRSKGDWIYRNAGLLRWYDESDGRPVLQTGERDEQYELAPELS